MCTALDNMTFRLHAVVQYVIVAAVSCTPNFLGDVKGQSGHHSRRHGTGHGHKERWGGEWARVWAGGTKMNELGGGTN